MAAGIVYLDADDEITSAAARIRATSGPRVALVVPYGSRIATSRMNFRLLSREAVVSNRRLSIIAGDAATRALAASAGLPVFGSVAEYETAGPADGGPDRPSRSAIDGGAATVDDRDFEARDSADVAEDDGPAVAHPAGSPDPGSSAVASTAAAGPLVGSLAESSTVAAIGGPHAAATADTTAMPTAVQPRRPAASAASSATAEPRAPRRTAPVPVAAPARSPRAVEGYDDRDLGRHGDEAVATRRRPGARALAVLAILGLAAVVLAVGAYLFLPSATIAVTPRREPISVDLDVAADPTATEVDPAAGVVPAVRIDVPVQAAQTFTTTGKHVEEAAARGSVTFTNYDTSSGVSIPSGSVVATEGGIRFRTQATVVLQPARILPFNPTSRSVQVVATRSGEGGNVPANAIRIVPAGQNPNLLRVNNPADLSGGVHTETPEVTKDDVDKAVAALTAQLRTSFQDAVASGAGAPAGTTLFPDTATLGDPTPSVDPQTLVGQAVPTFDLSLSASGTVIAVDPSPVRSIAEAQLKAKVGADHRLVDGSVDVEVGEGTVGEDGQVTFEARAHALRIAILDPDQLRSLVKGKTVEDARTALAKYGDVRVDLWPSWVTTVTGVDARLSVTVDEGATVDASPSPAPSPARSAVPTSSHRSTAPRASSATVDASSATAP